MSESQPVAKGPIILAAAILFSIAAIFVALEWFGPVPQPGAALGGSLTETQTTAITLIVDLAKLFMGWSVAVIGGAGYFLKANIEKGYRLSRLDLLLAEAVILASVVSIFYGHLSINFVVTMLVKDLLNLDDPALASRIQIQYLTFLSSLLLFGAYIHSTFFDRTRPTDTVSQSDTQGGAM